MKFLSSEKLSAHKYKTPEGYLICTDAILARTGKQSYRRSEVFNDSDDDSEIEIDRKAEEVFAPATLASFENKPITVEHPNENVGPDNYNDLSVGFVRDVRRGVVDGQDVMLGTLVITDAQTIEEIENGEHTDLSCGYDCDIADEANPQQRNIRGNHVALCEQGRAGIARIVDSVKDTKFVVYNEDDDRFGKFDTKEEAQTKIKELKAFDKRNGNPFEEHYRIELEDASCKDDIVFDYSEEDLAKAKAMFEKAEDETEKKLLKTLIDKIEFELMSRKQSDSKCKDAGEHQEELAQKEYEKLKAERRAAENEIDRNDNNDRFDMIKAQKELDEIDAKIKKLKSIFGYAIHDDLSSEVKNWWEKVEKENYIYSWGFRINNFEATGREMLSAMFDILPLLKNKDIDLYNEGKKIYNRYAYSKYNDSIKDVDPREGESKEDFIARFMSETKEEYPDEKQRFAVANSYWERKHTKDSKYIEYKGYEIEKDYYGNDIWEFDYKVKLDGQYHKFTSKEDAMKFIDKFGTNSKYTIRYVDNDTVYIKTVRAKSTIDAVKKFKK